MTLRTWIIWNRRKWAGRTLFPLFVASYVSAGVAFGLTFRRIERELPIRVIECSGFVYSDEPQISVRLTWGVLWGASVEYCHRLTASWERIILVCLLRNLKCIRSHNLAGIVLLVAIVTKSILVRCGPFSGERSLVRVLYRDGEPLTTWFLTLLASEHLYGKASHSTPS